MSAEVPPASPGLLRQIANAWTGDSTSDDSIRRQLRARADRLERKIKPLPTVPGWYPTIVVERGGESCTGALLRTDRAWSTAFPIAGLYHHYIGGEPTDATIRWAEQDGTTPGQTASAAYHGASDIWDIASPSVRALWDHIGFAVLAAHGTPTLTPVREHPEPGTRGLLPLMLDEGEWVTDMGAFICTDGSPFSKGLLTDPYPDGAP